MTSASFRALIQLGGSRVRGPRNAREHSASCRGKGTLNLPEGAPRPRERPQARLQSRTPPSAREFWFIELTCPRPRRRKGGSSVSSLASLHLSGGIPRHLTSLEGEVLVYPDVCQSFPRGLKKKHQSHAGSLIWKINNKQINKTKLLPLSC